MNDRTRAGTVPDPAANGAGPMAGGRRTPVLRSAIDRLALGLFALWLHAGTPWRAWRYVRRHGGAAALRRVRRRLLGHSPATDYATWVRQYDTLSDRDARAILDHIGRLPERPRLTVVMPVAGAAGPDPVPAAESVLAQLYPDWEMLVAAADDAPPRERARLAELAARDPRVRLLSGGAGGAEAVNRAARTAQGGFLLLLDPADALPRHALYMMALEILRHPDAAMVYADEDRIDDGGRRTDPHFKPDWNPDLFHSRGEAGGPVAVRRSLFGAVGGLRGAAGEAAAFDLLLRVTEAPGAGAVRHIPHVLCHRRGEPRRGGGPDACRALAGHFARRGIAAGVAATPAGLRVLYPVPEPEPPVSLIVPTRDRAALLHGCVEGLLERTDYRNLEVLVVDNGSVEAETHACLAALESRGRVRVLRHPGPFNYSAINNAAVAQARGAVIGLINNDIAVLEPHWLREMVGHALRPEVGAVGAKLYYADDTVQHAGVIVGIGGVADHGHRRFPKGDPGYFGQLALTRDVTCVTAACLLTRRAVFDEVGGLDERDLPVAFNDVDFCLRLRKRGYLVVWTPYAELHHLESASRGDDAVPGKRRRLIAESRRMRRRWGRDLLADPYYNPNLTLESCDFGLAFPPRSERPWIHRKRS